MKNMAFPQFAYSTGLISATLRDTLTTLAEQCVAAINAGNYVDAYNKYCYYNLLNPILAISGVDPYDYRKSAASGSAASDIL